MNQDMTAQRPVVIVKRVINPDNDDITHCQIFVGDKVFDAPFTESSNKLCERIYDATEIELTVQEVMQVTNSCRAQMVREGKRLESALASLPEGAVAILPTIKCWLAAFGEMLWAEDVTVNKGSSDDHFPGHIEDIGEIDTDELYQVSEEIRGWLNAPAPNYEVANLEWLRSLESWIQASREASGAGMQM